jgi:N-terminal acetyltransferase B complex non-catalytic subunit
LIAAYKYGSFSKIPEFTQFSQKLDSSFHFAAVTTERMLLDLLEVNSHSRMVQMASSMSADPDKDQPKWDTLVDNRDLKIFVSWDPPSK